MQFRFPREREARKAVIERLLVNHHVDISRLWKNLPQIPQPSIGVPFTGPLAPVPFLFSDAGSGSFPLGGFLCDATHVSITLSDIEAPDGTAGTEFAGMSCTLMNGTWIIQRTSLTDRDQCQFQKITQVYYSPGGSPGGRFEVFVGFNASVPGSARNTVMLQIRDTASTFRWQYRYVHPDGSGSIGNATWPITVTKYSQTANATCGNMPETIVIEDASQSGSVT